jgi:hypothetical protein
MRVADIDRAEGYSEGFGPLAQCVQWLDTLTRSPSVTWTPGQREAAERAVRDARQLLGADVLNMARETLDLSRAMDERRGSL